MRVKTVKNADRFVFQDEVNTLLSQNYWIYSAGFVIGDTTISKEWWAIMGYDE